MLWVALTLIACGWYLRRRGEKLERELERLHTVCSFGPAGYHMFEILTEGVRRNGNRRGPGEDRLVRSGGGIIFGLTARHVLTYKSINEI